MKLKVEISLNKDVKLPNDIFHFLNEFLLLKKKIL